MSGDCVFCKIVAGEIPSEKVWEDENFIAILDAFPSMKGQTLLVTKEHYSSDLLEMDDDFYCKYFKTAKKIANGIKKAFNSKRAGFVVEGLEVDHAHIRIYPLDSGLRLERLDPKPSDEEMKEISEKIKSSL
tara:strand:- start:2166 stop:2561 length:396 start_codon:yes stop_codon:yes gene_type:complete